MYTKHEKLYGCLHIKGMLKNSQSNQFTESDQKPFFFFFKRNCLDKLRNFQHPLIQMQHKQAERCTFKTQ